MALDLERHLVAIGAQLELEPVLRFLRSEKLLSQEICDEIKRNVALVNSVAGLEDRVRGFLRALRQTGQLELAELIESDDDGYSGKTGASGLGTAESSKRSRFLRAKVWRCGGLPEDGCVEGAAAEPCDFSGVWQSHFQWCRRCRRYLCQGCVAGPRHRHRSSAQWLGLKTLHGAVYDRLKKDDDREKRRLCGQAEELGQRLAAALQQRLLARWSRRSACQAFERHLQMDLADPVGVTVDHMSSSEAFTAAAEAISAMGVELSPALAKELPPPGCMDEEPELLLRRLLAAGDPDVLEDEALAQPQVQAALEEDDDETLALVPEQLGELPDLAALRGGSGGIKDGLSLQTVYGDMAQSETTEEDSEAAPAIPAPPPLLRLLMRAALDESGDYEPRARAWIAEAGEAELSARDAMGLGALHLAAVRGATGFAARLLDNSETEVDPRNESGDTPLMLAALNDQMEMARQLLDRGADRMAQTQRGDYPVHFAASGGSGRLMKLLLEGFASSEVDAVGEAGRTALFVAASQRSLECVEALLEAGADQTLVDAEGDTPLSAAAQEGRLAVVQRLLRDDKSLVNAQNEAGYTALMRAVSVPGQEAVARELLAAGADVKVRAGPEGFAAIHIAAEEGSLKLVRELIDRGSPVNFDGQHSCVLQACLKGHVEMVRLLVEAGADADFANEEGHCALTVACQEDYQELLEYLLSLPLSEAKDELRRRNAGRALITAAKYGRLALVKALLGSTHVTADWVSSDEGEEGSQATHAAAQEGHAHVLRYLLHQNVPPDALNDNGTNALIIAAGKGHMECVEVLLAGGAAAALVTPVGTALHSAVEYGQAEAAELLLQALPPPPLEATDEDGATALHLAARDGQTGLFLRLRSLGAKMAALTGAGDNCLHLAAQGGHLDIVQGLCSDEEGRALVNAQGRGGSTTLIRAAFGDSCEVARVLLEAGADASVLTTSGAGVLHLAAMHGKEELAELLLASEKADAGQPDALGRSPLIFAAIAGRLTLVQILHKAGADLDAFDANDAGPLHYAAAADDDAGRAATLAFLLSAGAAVEKTGPSGSTCLHWAAEGGHADAVGALLATKRLDVNLRDAAGGTPLHFAAAKGNVEAAKVLLSFGADVGAQDAAGDSPVDLAARLGHAELLRCLLGRLGDAGAHGSNGKAAQWLSGLDQ